MHITIHCNAGGTLLVILRGVRVKLQRKMLGLFDKPFSTLPLFIFISLKKSNKKHFNFFTLFISHQSYFITIQIKKFNIKQNFFTFP